ncbi:glycosyltransferase family 2 protein [Shewanella vesiculosa]|uniref:glycosyltransferase family 2 protein n=1 Tax=Shewanella vesiculosa TaxID=518738 RepID=UPI00384FEC94
MQIDLLVSVVIPYYKHFKYIEHTIESVFSQTYKNIELIVVDDGSNDGENDILQTLNKRFPFKLYRKDNGGVSSALNYGIKRSKGEFIAIIGSDDIMLPERIAKQVSVLLAKKNLYGCGTYVERIDERGRFINRINPRLPASLDFDYFYSNKFYFPAPAAMYRYTALKSVDFFSENEVIEDWDLCLKLTASGGELILIDSVTTQYRLHLSTSNNYLKMYKGVINVAKKYSYKSKIKYYNIFWYQLAKYVFKSIKAGQYKTAFTILSVMVFDNDRLS